MLTFFLLALIMTVGAVGVITLHQPVHAALALVGTLLTLAITYVTLQAHFLAAIQVIVYAGAIMVLFLFVIMLLNVQGDTTPPRGFRWLKPAAYFTAAFAAAGIISTITAEPRPLPELATITAALRGGGAGPIGEALFVEFMFAFQLVGVLLLTGIIGAVALVQRKALANQRPSVEAGVPQAPARPERNVEVF
jgi:NADH-quinone oxidoreductase subunit J